MPKTKEREVAREAIERGARDFRISADDKPLNTELAIAVIGNPDNDGKSEAVATFSLRDDPLGRLHKRSQISEVDYAAGHWLQAQFEALGRATLRGVDISRPFVDTQYGSRDPVGGAQQRAAKNIIKAHNALGREGFVLVREVLAERKFIEQVASERGLTSQREIDYLGRRFRECLHTLSHAFGFVARGDRIPTPKDGHRDDADSFANAVLRHAMILAGADLKPDARYRSGGDTLRIEGVELVAEQQTNNGA